MEQNHQPLKINTQRVGELMSAISPKQTMEARFRFNMSTQDALDLLAAAYQYEVQRRQRAFILDANTENILIKLAEYLTQQVPKFGILCCGTCGNGKTTLLYAFQRVVNYLQRKRHFSFLDSENNPFEASIGIFRAKEIAQMSRERKEFKALMLRPMLAIDDMGTEPAEVYDYNNINTPIVDVIDYRYNHQLFTFITTNLIARNKNTGSDKGTVTIRMKYGDRIADRFNEMLHVITFKDISYRAI